jgi:hypothetical protein
MVIRVWRPVWALRAETRKADVMGRRVIDGAVDCVEELNYFHYRW